MFAQFTDRSWLWLAAGFYLAGFLLGTASLWRGGRPSNAVNYAAIVAGYLLQLFGLYLRGRAVGGCPLGNRFEIYQFTAWSAITLYLAIGVTFRSSVLGYLTSGLAAGLSFLSLSIPAWDPALRTQIFGGNAWIELHAALAVFSYGVFGLLALTAVMLLLRNYSLKTKHLGGWFSFLPSMLDLDHISVRLLTAGVALLATSLAVGSVYWLRDLSTVNAGKLLITIAVGLAYAIALVLRLRGSLLAQRFALTCVMLFLVALVSLGPVDASRRPPAPPPPVVPR
jgi:HemX protein